MHSSPHRPSPRVRVWDLPLRLFHWLLASAMVAAWLTRGDRTLAAHVFVGYVALLLLTFRVYWGFAGTRHARFASFRYSWRDVRAYLYALFTRRAVPYAGHNPAGSWAVFALLAVALIIALSGLAVQGGEERHGLLATWLSPAAGDMAHRLHGWFAWGMLGLVGMHVAGVLVESRWHRTSLIAAMLHGRKPAPAGESPVASRASVAAALAAGVTFAAAVYFLPATAPLRSSSAAPATAPLPDNALWRAECGSCHLAYHPSLLPARSWRRLMAEQHAHFAEDLALAPETVSAITDFLQNNAAEGGVTEAAWKMQRSVPATETPQRITGTPYWRRKHAALAEAAWRTPPVGGRHDCAACHQDAQSGLFEDGGIDLPRTLPASRAIPAPMPVHQAKPGVPP